MSEPTPIDLYRAPNAEVEAEGDGRRGMSRLGVASIAVGVVSALTFIAAVTLALVWKMGDGASDEPAAQTHTLVVGLMTIAACGGLVVGIALAIAGLLQPKRARAPAIIGLVLNAFVVLVFALLLIIGLAARE